MPAKRAPRAKTTEVTFTLPRDVGADRVELSGEFNDWASVPLDRNVDGSWSKTVLLQPGNTYRYRYLLDGQRWENAWQADGYAPNPFGSEDSLIIVE